MFSVNYLAVLLSLIVYTVLGMLWYGPLFGKKWVALSGMEDMDASDPSVKKAKTSGYLSSLISSFITVLVLAMVMKAMGVHSPLGGLFVGAGLGFGFIAMAYIGESAWNMSPPALVLINASYRITALGIAGLIIGLW